MPPIAVAKSVLVGRVPRRVDSSGTTSSVGDAFREHTCRGVGFMVMLLVTLMVGVRGYGDGDGGT